MGRNNSMQFTRAFYISAPAALCLALGSASGQDERPAARPIARELAANQAAETLGIPQSFIKELRTGVRGALRSSPPKGMLAPDELEGFVKQFDEAHGTPYIKVRPTQQGNVVEKKYYLIPLELLKQQ